MSGRVDLSRPTSVHIIGIGGAGMAAIAEVLHGMGHRVAGSDQRHSDTIDRLVGLGIGAVVGHSVGNLDTGPPPDLVVRSTAIPDTNVEVQTVLERGGRVLRRYELLAAIAAMRRTVAVAGTHGKTTTTAMLAIIARAAGIDPSFIVGGDVTGLGTGAAWGTGEWFVVEADESDGTFLELGHTIGVITNVEPDHLEHYGGEDRMRAAFAEFAKASQVAVICADDRGAAELAIGSNAVTYGREDTATYRIERLERDAAGSRFHFVRSGTALGTVAVPMPGLHNARNAAGAAAAALEMGIGFESVRAGLGSFGGVARRFDARGEVGGIRFVDDYAHLPTEVRSALDAARDLGARRIVAVFQPHRYSRTEAHWKDFAGAFDDADLLIVTDVYSSGEAPRPGVSGELIVRAVVDEAGSPETIYHADRASLPSEIAGRLRPGDLCITLGAGDSVALADEIRPLVAGNAGGGPE